MIFMGRKVALPQLFRFRSSIQRAAAFSSVVMRFEAEAPNASVTAAAYSSEVFTTSPTVVCRFSAR